MGDNILYGRGIGTDEALGFADASSSKIFQTFTHYQGSYLAIVKPFWDGDDGVLHYMLYHAPNGSTRRILKKEADDKLYLLCNESISAAVSSSNFPAGSFRNIIANWDLNNTLDGTNKLKILLDGQSLVAGATLTVPTPAAPDSLNVGSVAGATALNGLIYYAILELPIPAYIFFDDFADGVYTGRASGNPGYPTWTVQNSAFTVSNGELIRTAEGGSGDISTPSTDMDDMVWEFNFQLSAVDATGQIMFFLNDDASFATSASGYRLQIRPANNRFSLDRENDAAFIGGAAAWTADTNKHHARVTRRAGGHWEIFLDGDSIGTPATENNITTNGFVGLYSQNNTNRISNVKIYRMADAWARDLVLMAQDLYNFSGAADVWDGRRLYVDEHTLLVPKHCVDQNDNLASTVLDILSWPSLMPDNTDYDATMHNQVNDGNMEHIGTGNWTSVNSPLTIEKEADIRTGTQSLHIVANATAGADEGFKQVINSDSAGADYLIGVDYKVTTGSVKLELLDDGDSVLDTVTKTDKVWSEYRTAWTIPSGATGLRIQIASATAADDFNIDKMFCHKSLADNGGMEGTYVDEKEAAETMNVAPDWDKSTTVGSVSVAVATGGTDTLDEENTIIHSGGAAQKIDVDATLKGMQQFNLTLTDNAWYTASAWFFVVSGVAQLRIVTGDGNYDITSDTVGIWVRRAVTFQASAAGADDMYIQSLGGAAVFYVDDVTIVELDESAAATETPAAESASYEDGNF